MPDFSVPRWLEPPNAVERAKMEEAKTAALERAGAMLTRSIGLMRYRADTQAAIKNGVDPITAQQNALINNAPWLFSENPQAVANLTNREEANQIRERANLQLNQHRETQDLLRGQLNKITQERDEQRAEHQRKLEQAAQDKLDLGYSNLDLKQQLGEAQAKQRATDEEGKTLRSQLSQKRLKEQGDRNAQIRVEQMLQTDPMYGSLVQKVTTAQTHLDTTKRRKGSRIPLLGTTQEDVNAADRDLQQAKKELQDYRAKVGKRFNVDMAETDELGDEEEAAPDTTPSATPTTEEKTIGGFKVRKK